MITLYLVLSCFSCPACVVCLCFPSVSSTCSLLSSPLQQQLQFSDSPRPVGIGTPSPFPQQPHKATPAARRAARNPDTSTPSAMFPWERDDTSSVPRGRAAASSVAPSSEVISTVGPEAQGDCGIVEDLRKERDGECCFALPLSQINLANTVQND